MKEAEELLEKYRAGLCTPAEVQLLQKWFHHLGEDEVSELSSEDLISARLQFEKNIRHSILPVRSYRLWPQPAPNWIRGIAAVAAAVALIVLGVYFFNAPSSIVNRNSEIVNQNDVAPGKNGATLTLANGKVIELSDTKSGVVIGEDLRYNDNTVVISNAARDLLNSIDKRSPDKSGQVIPKGRDDGQGGEALVASTTNGQTYIFTLPDGTKVWLNAASSLTIPSGFSGTETRKVALSGEAYFEVTKNKAKPFIVESNGQEVTVLGTHFNISAYKDEGSVRTTLLEGSVRVSSLLSSRANAKDLIDLRRRAREGLGSSEPRNDKGARNNVTLVPNQQSVVSGSNRIEVKEVDTRGIVDWKNGDFVFETDDFKAIMRKVARWYDVEIVYDKTAPAELPLGGLVSRSKNISSILKIMEATGDVHFKIEGRRITVMK